MLLQFVYSLECASVLCSGCGQPTLVTDFLEVGGIYVYRDTCTGHGSSVLRHNNLHLWAMARANIFITASVLRWENVSFFNEKRMVKMILMHMYYVEIWYKNCDKWGGGVVINPKWKSFHAPARGSFKSTAWCGLWHLNGGRVDRPHGTFTNSLYNTNTEVGSTCLF